MPEGRQQSPQSSPPPEKRYRPLLIGGAARSGTTLLQNLLDGHPDLLVYPLEAHTVLRYFRVDPGARDAYFRGPFIESRSEGQQSILGSPPLLAAYREKMRGEFGTPFELDIDPRAYRRAYLAALAGRDVTLEHVLGALLDALVASSHLASSSSMSANMGVFKLPYATEVTAAQVARELPDCRFLQLIRHPHARYASWKSRLLRTGSGLDRGRIVCPRSRGVDFVTGISEITASSFHLGILNRRLLGRDRYQVIRYEDLVLHTESTMRRIADWLDIPFSDILCTPTRLGRAVASGSSFGPRKGVTAESVDRSKQYRQSTSLYERALHNSYLSVAHVGLLYDLHDDDRPPSFRDWLKPFKHERCKDYLWRLATNRGRIAEPSRELRDQLLTRRARSLKPEE